MAETMVIRVVGQFEDETEPGLSRSGKKIDQYEEKLKKTQAQLDKLGRTKATAKMDVEDRATSKIEKIMRTARGIGGKSYNFTVKAIDYATAPLRKIMNLATSLKGIVMMVGAKLALDKTISEPIGLADSYTGARIGFQTLFKDAERAQKMMDDIDNFAKSTPFKTSGIIANAQKMMAMGWNPDDIIADLGVLGDAAAATGKGDQGLESIIRALSQIKSKGKLSAEELNQLAEAGISAKRYLAEGLGYGSDDAGMAKLSADLEDGAIGANKAIDLIKKGMLEYQGMMETTSRETVEGIKSNIEDTFEIAIFRKWGMGLQEGAKRGLGAVVDYLDANEDRLNAFGDKAQEVATILSTNVADAAEKALEKVLAVSESPEFAAASIGGKAKMLFDSVLGEPIAEWWNTSGKASAEKVARDIGRLIGVGIVNGVAEGIKGIVIDASTILPGGDKASDTSMLSTGLVGYGAYKLGGGKLLSKLGKSVAKAIDVTDYTTFWKTADLAKTVSRADAVADATKSASALQKFFRSVGDDLLVDAARLSPKLAKVKGFFKGNWLSLLMSGAAIAQSDDKLGETTKQIGSLGAGLAGGKLGAAIGSAIAPGIGTAIGTALGSAVGFVGGEKLVDKLVGDFNITKALTGDTAVGTKGLKEMRDGLSENREKAVRLAEDYQTINDTLWEYGQLSGKLNDANLPLEKREAIQKRINGLVQELHEFYPNLISQYDVEQGKLSANLATIKEIAALDRERAKLELESEVNKQEKEFEKNDVAGKLKESNRKITEGTEQAQAMQDELSNLYLYNAELEKLLRLKEKHKEEGDWLSYNEDMDKISDYMTKVNEIMDKFGLKKYGYGADGAEKFTETGIDKFVESRQKVIDKVAEEYQLNDQLKATYQELYDSKLALIELDLGGSIEDTAKKYDTLDDKQKKVFDEALLKVQALQMEMNQLTEKDNIVNIKVVKQQVYGEEGTSYNAPDVGTVRKNIMSLVEKHAKGGILSKPHLGLVAEEGPEAIIPLSAGKRSRGLAVWEAAGKALGVSAYADGGMPVSYRNNSGANAANFNSNGLNGLVGSNTPSISLGGVEVNLNIPNGVTDTEGIVDAIRQQMPDIANEICRYIAINMTRIKGNVVTGGV